MAQRDIRRRYRNRLTAEYGPEMVVARLTRWESSHHHEPPSKPYRELPRFHTDMTLLHKKCAGKRSSYGRNDCPSNDGIT